MLKVSYVETANDTDIVMTDKPYDGVIGVTGRRRVTRKIRDVARNAEKIAHSGIKDLLTRIMFSNTTLFAMYPAVS